MKAITEWFRPLLAGGKLVYNAFKANKYVKGTGTALKGVGAVGGSLMGPAMVVSTAKDIISPAKEVAPIVNVNHNYPSSPDALGSISNVIKDKVTQNPGLALGGLAAGAAGLGYLAKKRKEDQKKQEQLKKE